MRRRILLGALVLVGIVPVASIATTSGEAATPAKWAAVNLSEATLIAGAFASGPVLFEHDAARMARGEACTKVYRFVPGKGPGEEIVSFHCAPQWGATVERFRLGTRRNDLGTCVLTRYQFAGDPEAHGVPAPGR